MGGVGFIAIDKPSGPTSHDVVAEVRRVTGIKKIGHAGTLDPPAQGVLVLALGRATRLIRFVQDTDKEYVALVRFGIATSTLDATGEIVEQSTMPITKDQLEAALEAFRGEISQVPPMVSALKVGGERLHAIARRGEEVERPPRAVQIYALSVEEFHTGEYPLAQLRVVCSKGTYIRSLADDIAVSLGGRAHLEGLVRTRVGAFRIERSLKFDQLQDWERQIIPVEEGLRHLDRITVSGAARDAVAHGRSLTEAAGEGPVLIIDEGGQALGVYQRHGGQARAEVVLS